MSHYASSVDPKEMDLFNRLADQWWDEEGQFSAIHRMNPIRLSFIRHTICQHFAIPDDSTTPFKDRSIIDIGCGGGVLAEPLARMGANVTGIDPCEKAIAVAQEHAGQSGLTIDYNAITAEEIGQTGQKADIVTAIEILEHVRDKQAFIESAAHLVKPGGLLIVSTLNRTLKAWALAIVASEHVLRWVPPGTHKWQDFVRPHELNSYCQNAGLLPFIINGMVYDPLKHDFALSKSDYSINYIMAAAKS